MKDSGFVFGFVQLLFCKCHEINANYGGSYIDSPNQIKKQKPTINPINKKDNKCFQYITVALNHEEIKKSVKNNKH